MRGFNALFNHALAGHGIINSFASSVPVIPGVVPTAPGPNDMFKEGANCTFSWTPDLSGQWKQLTVQLMSGDNLNMIPVTTVATLDGTDPTTTIYSYACPDVQPNSAIYFYQFSTPAAPKNLTWTTRFTIAAADGSTTPPAHDTQPDGQKISWGAGALVDQSKVVPPPDYLGGGASITSSSATPSLSTSTTSSSTSSSTSTTSTSSAPTSSSDSSTSSTTLLSTTSNIESSANTVTTVTSTSTAGSTSSTTSASDQDKLNSALGGSASVAFGPIVMGITAVVSAILS